jgi:hypothetical protein
VFEMSLKAAFLKQATSCKSLGSPFMGRLLTILAANWPNDTELAKRFESWQGEIGSSGASLPLRVAGGLHSLVLLKKDAPLAQVYPPFSVEENELKVAAIEALRRHDHYLCKWVENAPQTNEVGRSLILIAASHWLNARFQLPIKLSELGASAGLNLLFDKFSLQINGQNWGPRDSPVMLKPNWRGQLPPQSLPQITDRRGVDINPLNVSLSEDVLRLMSYIWPDQTDRIARTRAAIAQIPPAVDAGDAIEWLAKRLENPKSKTLHLVYHTIAWQYFPLGNQILGRNLIEAAGAIATESEPLAWLSMEADGLAEGALITVRLWPGDIKFSFGRAGFHGQWVDWLPLEIDIPTAD